MSKQRPLSVALLVSLVLVLAACGGSGTETTTTTTAAPTTTATTEAGETTTTTEAVPVPEADVLRVVIDTPPDFANASRYYWIEQLEQRFNAVGVEVDRSTVCCPIVLRR